MSKLFINDRISRGSWSLEKFEISVLILFLFESRAFLLAFLKLIHFFLRSIVIQSIYILPIKLCLTKKYSRIEEKDRLIADPLTSF